MMTLMIMNLVVFAPGWMDDWMDGWMDAKACCMCP